MITDEIKYDNSKLPIIIQKEKKVEERDFRPQIDHKKCTKCTLCVVFCPHDCIEIKGDEFPKIIYDYCTGCLVCLRECPWTAITEIKEKV